MIHLIERSRPFTRLLALVTCLVSQAWARDPGALRQNQTWASRVYPGHLDYPIAQDWQYFGGKLDGQLITPLDPGYLNASRTRNLRVMRLPGAIVKARTVADIQRTVLFARKYNLHLTVRSSGHDFIGRCSHDGSLNLDLENMKDMKVNLTSSRSPAGEIKVQSGASWLEVYTQVDKILGPDKTGQKNVGRLIVGATGQTVAVGGFTLSGGHSPISRKFGVAVDGLLEATVVTADGKVHITSFGGTVTTDVDGSVTTTSDSSLFVAVSGGGGGTWGVVVDFTFRLFYAPERFRRILAVIPALDKSGTAVNKVAVEYILERLSKLSPDWGGYLIMARNPDEGNQSGGSVILFLNHQGSNSSSSNQEVEPVLRHPSVSFIEEKYHPTFLDYQRFVPDTPYYNSYVFNSFIETDTVSNATKRAEFVDLLYAMLQENIQCNATLIGGNMLIAIRSPLPVNPWMRLGVLTVTCDVTLRSRYNSSSIDKALDYAHQLYSFGKGSFLGEPAEDMPDWKTRLWGPMYIYNRLLDTKKKVDPTNFFRCHNCVGSDLGDNYGAPDSQGLPGQPAYNYFNTSRQFDEIWTPQQTR